MNVNNVYLAKIYVKKFEVRNGYKIINHEGVFVKNTLVQEDLYTLYSPRYIDLTNGKVYNKFDVSNVSVGELYLRISEGLIPLTSIIDTKRKNMSKRRILKKYNENNKK